jgi:phosphoglycolate phosphatase-like HAD superfamily hydrolase
MIYEVLRDLAVTDKSTVLFVGDSPEDFAAAAEAGVSFCYANVFFAAPNNSQPMQPSIPGYELKEGN